MSALPAIDTSERRRRLAVRHRLAPGHRASSVEAAAASVVCLHATDPATVYLSAWARMEDFTVDAMDKALYVDRSLVKHLAMRRTLFVFPRNALPAVQASSSARVAAAETKRLARAVEQAGLHPDGDSWLEAACVAVLEALPPGREATSSELRDELALLAGGIVYGEGRKWGGEVPIGPRVLTVLSARGQVIRATNVGGWTTSRPRWATTESWLGAPIEPMDEAVAWTEQVRRWLGAFGPGTVKDIQWWLGSTLGQVRAALAELDAVEVDMGGSTGVALPDDVERTDAVEPWAALLPALDPTTMGWQQRDWYLGGHKAKLFDSAGNAGQSAWWDGRIVGGWHQPDGFEVVLDLWEDVGKDAEAALLAEAEDLGKWLSAVRVRPRFPGPFQSVQRQGVTAQSQPDTPSSRASSRTSQRPPRSR